MAQNKTNKIVGSILIIVGSIGLVLSLLALLLPFHLVPKSAHISKWDISPARPVVNMPSAIGRSPLDSIYALNKKNKKGDDNYYLDSSLWYEKPVPPLTDTLRSYSADSAVNPTVDIMKNVVKDSTENPQAPVTSAPEETKATDLKKPQDDSILLHLKREKLINRDSFPTIANTPDTPGRDSTESNQKKLKVEFWNSPVNFKGYKLEGLKLILYGMDPDKSYRFENHSDGIWMITDSTRIHLQESPEFQKFI